MNFGSHCEQIKANSAEGTTHPRSWTITTECGINYDMWKINRYAKAEDLAD